MGHGIITRRGLDTSDATATEADAIAGKTFYANGMKKTGNLALEGKHAYKVEKWTQIMNQPSSTSTDYRFADLALYNSMTLESGTGVFTGDGGAQMVNLQYVTPALVNNYIGKFYTMNDMLYRIDGTYERKDYYDLYTTSWYKVKANVKVVLTNALNGYSSTVVGGEIRTDIM